MQQTDYLTFLEFLDCVLEGMPSEDSLIFLLKRYQERLPECPKVAFRRNSLPDLNPDGGLLLVICAMYGLFVTSTMFEHRVAHKCSTRTGQIRRGAELSTDHHLVGSWVEWVGRLLDRLGKQKHIVRVNRECLVEPPVHAMFSSHLQEFFTCNGRGL